MANISLLGSTSRVVTPFIKVTIGNYTFGVYQRTDSKMKDNDGFYKAAKITYPNYVQSLEIQKINGQVNIYSLELKYAIPDKNTDPNFFEKVFSSVSQTRKIVFSYGDMSLPTFIYKDEQAIITKIITQFDPRSAVITYTVSAVSSATLGLSGTYNFPAMHERPSVQIKYILNNPTYGLKEIFYGMSNSNLVDKYQLIPGDDASVDIEAKTNISILDYLSYLVQCMKHEGSGTNTQQQTLYFLTIHDDSTPENGIATGTFGGPYFKVASSSAYMEHSDAYSIDIGWPSANIVTSFSITDDENYSIYYDYQGQLNPEQYVKRINDKGELEEVYAPPISSKNSKHKTRTVDQTWWSKVTEYPISASITIKGLLRPAILMSYVNLNVYFWGNKHISSGTYIVTKQIDRVSGSGYSTTLSLTRIAGAKEGI